MGWDPYQRPRQLLLSSGPGTVLLFATSLALFVSGVVLMFAGLGNLGGLIEVALVVLAYWLLAMTAPRIDGWAKGRRERRR